MNKIKLIFSITILILISYKIGLAKTINVPTDYPTIQGAIDASLSGDMINVKPSVTPYKGDGNKNIRLNGLAILLIAESGATIDCEDDGQGFIFDGKESKESVIFGFKIINVQSDDNYAIVCRNSSPFISHCIIQNNESGGIYCDTSSPIINNCLIANNHGTAIYCTPYSNPLIKNSTISFNNDTANIYGGLYCDKFSMPTIINTIFYRNQPKEILYTGNGPIVSYSAIFGGFSGFGLNNIGDSTFNPLFENSSSGNFRLKSGSPCINKGYIESTTAITGIENVMVDLDMIERPLGNNNDIGAYEYLLPTVDVFKATPYSGTAPLESTIYCSAKMNGSISRISSYIVDYGDDSSIETHTVEYAEDGTFDENIKEFKHEYNKGGLFKAICTITNAESYTVSSSIDVQVREFKWRFGSQDIIESSPAIGSDGTIYFGSDDHRVYALEDKGKYFVTKWAFPTSERVTSSPAVGSVNGKDVIYIGSEDKNLYAINQDGTMKWSFNTGDYMYSSPAVGYSGTVYVGSCNGCLYAINPDGTSKWTYFIGSKVISSPIAVSSPIAYTSARMENVLIGSLDNYLYVLEDKQTYPILKWRFNTGAEIYNSPSVGKDGTIYVAGCNMFGPKQTNYLFALNANGTKKWSYPIGRGAYYSSPILYYGKDGDQQIGVIYLGSYDNELYAINLDGTKRWSVGAFGDVHSTPLVDSTGTVYFGSTDRAIYAVDAKGNTKWKYGTEGQILSSPAISSAGILYIGSYDNNLYAIQTDSKGLSSDSTWPTFHANSAHTGYVVYSSFSPTIINTWPAQNESSISTGVPITITVDFSMPMDISSILNNDKAFTLEDSNQKSISGVKISCETVKIYSEDTVTIGVPYTIVTRLSMGVPYTALENSTSYIAKVSSDIKAENNVPLITGWNINFNTKKPISEDSEGSVRGCFIESLSE